MYLGRHCIKFNLPWDCCIIVPLNALNLTSILYLQLLTVAIQALDPLRTALQQLHVPACTHVLTLIVM